MFGGRATRATRAGKPNRSRLVKMNAILGNFHATLLLFFAILTVVGGIKCYQCNSIEVEKSPYQCNEFFDDSDLEPEPCDEVHNAQYCIKQIGIFEGGLLTKRFCSSEYLGNYCNYLQQPGGRAPYRSCFFTCQGDGCNSADRFHQAKTFTLLVVAVFLLHRAIPFLV